MSRRMIIKHQNYIIKHTKFLDHLLRAIYWFMLIAEINVKIMWQKYLLQIKWVIIFVITFQQNIILCSVEDQL